MATLTARQDIEYQLAHDISELGRMMVRFDQWIKQAGERRDWETLGDLERQRLATQEHRSQLMGEQFAWRKRRQKA